MACVLNTSTHELGNRGRMQKAACNQRLLGQALARQQATLGESMGSAPDLPVWLKTHHALASEDVLLKALRKTGGDNGHVHLALVLVVDDGAEDDVGGWVRQAGHHLGSRGLPPGG